MNTVKIKVTQACLTFLNRSVAGGLLCCIFCTSLHSFMDTIILPFPLTKLFLPWKSGQKVLCAFLNIACPVMKHTDKTQLIWYCLLRTEETLHWSYSAKSGWMSRDEMFHSIIYITIPISYPNSATMYTVVSFNFSYLKHLSIVSVLAPNVDDIQCHHDLNYEQTPIQNDEYPKRLRCSLGWTKIANLEPRAVNSPRVERMRLFHYFTFAIT